MCAMPTNISPLDQRTERISKINLSIITNLYRKTKQRRIYTIQLRNKFSKIKKNRCRPPKTSTFLTYLTIIPLIFLVYRFFEQSEEIQRFQKCRNSFPCKRREENETPGWERGAGKLQEVLCEARGGRGVTKEL